MRLDVADWLRGLGLEQYASAFRDNAIEADVLPSLNADDLKDIGVTPVGHRRRLLNAIAVLNKLEALLSGAVRSPQSVSPQALSGLRADLPDRQEFPGYCNRSRRSAAGILRSCHGHQSSECRQSQWNEYHYTRTLDARR